MGESSKKNRRLKKVPDEGDNKKRVEKPCYAKHIFPFNYVTYIYYLTQKLNHKVKTVFSNNI